MYPSSIHTIIHDPKGTERKNTCLYSVYFLLKHTRITNTRGEASFNYCHKKKVLISAMLNWLFFLQGYSAIQVEYCTASSSGTMPDPEATTEMIIAES